jgi:hypothetical protein
VTSGTWLTLTPECWYRFDKHDYRKNANAGLTLFLTFQYSGIDSARACLTDRETASQHRKTELCSPTELSCTLLSYVAPFWAKPYPIKLDTLHSPKLHCILLNKAASYHALMQTSAPSELWCTLLSQWAPYWAMLHPPELCCTFLSFAAFYEAMMQRLWATLYPTELCCTLLNYAAPSGAPQHPSELSCTLLATLHPSELP